MLANSVSQFVWEMLLLSDCRLQPCSGLSSCETPGATWNTAGDDWSSCTSCSSGRSSVKEIQKRHIDHIDRNEITCSVALLLFLSKNKHKKLLWHI